MIPKYCKLSTKKCKKLLTFFFQEKKCIGFKKKLFVEKEIENYN